MPATSMTKEIGYTTNMKTHAASAKKMVTSEILSHFLLICLNGVVHAAQPGQDWNWDPMQSK